MPKETSEPGSNRDVRSSFENSILKLTSSDLTTPLSIDTGIDYTHPALGGKFGPGNKIIGGYDFVGDLYNGTTCLMHVNVCVHIFLQVPMTLYLIRTRWISATVHTLSPARITCYL